MRVIRGQENARTALGFSRTSRTNCRGLDLGTAVLASRLLMQTHSAQYDFRPFQHHNQIFFPMTFKPLQAFLDMSIMSISLSITL